MSPEQRRLILDGLEIMAIVDGSSAIALRAMATSDEALAQRAIGVFRYTLLANLTAEQREVIARAQRVAVDLVQPTADRRTRWLQVRLSEDEYDELQAAAEAVGVSVSEYVRTRVLNAGDASA